MSQIWYVKVSKLTIMNKPLLENLLYTAHYMPFVIYIILYGPQKPYDFNMTLNKTIYLKPIIIIFYKRLKINQI